MQNKRPASFTGDLPVAGTKVPGVYVYVQPSTECIYIGSTVNAYGRFVQHTSALKRGGHVNRKFQHAFDRDPNFRVGFIPLPENERTGDVIEKLRAQEQFLLDSFPDKSKILNIAHDTVACGGGISPSAETRVKISAAMKGRHISEETRRRRSETMRGVTHTEERRKNVSESRTKYRVQVGEQLFDNVVVAAKALGFANKNSVRFRCLSEHHPEYRFVNKNHNTGELPPGNSPTI